MVEMLRRIFQGGCDVLILQIRIVAQNLSAFGAASQHIQNVRDADSLTTNARSSPTHLWV